jgi:hemerythrin-like domain-containing protein
MMTIIEVLIAEHAVFLTVFDQIEGLLPNLSTVGEVRILISLVERLLHDHGEAEKKLAYAALDHVLEDKGRLDRMHQEHQEIDVRLSRVRTARSLAEARQLCKAALDAAREHFRHEEESVFPLVASVLQDDTLAALGNARLQRQAVVAG